MEKNKLDFVIHIKNDLDIESMGEIQKRLEKIENILVCFGSEIEVKSIKNAE